MVVDAHPADHKSGGPEQSSQHRQREMAEMDLRACESSESRFETYVEGLMSVIGHADRAKPLRDYCLGLAMPGERKSVEPLAAVTAPARVAAQHQSLLHFVANAPWSDEAVLGTVRALVQPAIERGGPIEAWLIDDTGFPKKGRHSVGVTRQYCGELGKQDNCQVAVTLSIANRSASLPIAYRLYLPEDWAADAERRAAAKVPEQIVFQTKGAIALDQIRAACRQEVPRGVVVMDAGYGNNTRLRDAISALDLRYTPASSRARRYGHPACRRRRRGRGSVVERGTYVARQATSRSRSRRWPSACRKRRGAASRGARRRAAD